MSLLYGAKFISPSSDESKPHILGFSSARTSANSLLLDIWNGATSAGRKAGIDLNGKFYSAALTAGDILYAVTGGVTGVRRLDSLAKGTAGQLLRMNAGATAPEWTSGLLVSALGNVGIGGQAALDAMGLRLDGDTTTGATQYAFYMAKTLSGTTLSVGWYAVGGVKASTAVTEWRTIHVAGPGLFSGASVGTCYGIYVDDINSGSTNYAIRTGAGIVKLGALAGVSSRAVVADANGVLSAP